MSESADQQEMYKALCGGAEHIFSPYGQGAEKLEQDARERERRVDLELARRQNIGGHPIWSPPDDFTQCLDAILVNCGVVTSRDPQRARYVKDNFTRAELEKRHLPHLSISVLQKFDLTLAQAIDFQLTARWIKVQTELRAQQVENVYKSVQT